MCSLDIKKLELAFMGVTVISKVGEIGIHVPSWRSVCNSYPFSFSILLLKSWKKIVTCK